MKKHCVWRHFYAFRRKTLVFTMFLQRQGQTSSKTSLFTLSFSECVETLCFAMFFQQGALNVPQILGFSMVFFIFLFPVLKASQPKTLVFTVS